MLTYLLALTVGLGSLALYATTFTLPEVSRKNDLIWSGVGLFYALVLWVCAGRITGGVLLGQLASVSLIGWFGWQTMEGRWRATPENERVNADKVAGMRDRLSGLATKVQDLSASVATKESDLNDAVDVALDGPPLTRADFGNPPKTDQREAVKPTLTSFSNPDAGNLLGGLMNKAQSILTNLTKPKTKEPKTKEVYVRKSFKDGVTETVTEAVVTVGSAIEGAIGDSDAFEFGEIAVEQITEPVTTIVTSATPSSQSTVEAEVAEVVETKVVEVLDEFGDAIPGNPIDQ